MTAGDGVDRPSRVLDSSAGQRGRIAPEHRHSGGGGALGQAIRQAQEEAGKSQREVGEAVGVDQTMVSMWVRGKAMPTLERILALDEAFGLPAGTLLARAGLIGKGQMADPSLADLVKEMLGADQIDIVGVLPRVLGGALLEHDGYGTPTRPADRFTYYTPARGRVLAYQQAHTIGPLIQRWMLGLVTFQNWVVRNSQEADLELVRQNVYLVDDLFLDCIVISRSRLNGVRIFTLTLLPQPMSVNAASSSHADNLIMTELVDHVSISNVVDRVNALRSASRPLATHRLVCENGALERAEPSGALPNEFVPQLVGIVPPGASQIATAFAPATVIALYADSARGPGLLLKRRTMLNAHTDYDTLALLSEQVAEEDLSFTADNDALSHDPDIDVLDHWWKLLDKPSAIVIPHSAFIAAGKRELFISSGLDINDDRFVYCGSVALEADGARYNLGFLGFRVVLRRDGEIDELNRALQWNPDLMFVRVADLYGLPSGVSAMGQELRLNRLLRLRPEWVTNVLLAESDA